mgnify:CR=1 FL=1
MSDQQTDCGAAFRALHEGPDPFVIPNPWDAGSARLLASLGFKALATTSAGFAFSLGRPEGLLTRDEVLAHCRDIVGATALPVSADLEKGFGDTPESAAETAAAEAARALPQDFVLTARCENFLWGCPDLDDTLRRLQAFEQAGADVLYAPGLRSLEDIRTVCAAVGRPVNVVMGMPGAVFTVRELAGAGVKRISVGSALARLAYGACLAAAQEIAAEGSFDALASAAGFAEFEDRFRPFVKS